MGALWLAPFANVTARADTPAALPVVPLHSDYPTGVKVKDRSPVSDEEMDCNWNVDCSSGTVVFHQSTQEQLGRVGGWLQSGSYKKKSKAIVFLTWGSTYSSESSMNDSGTPAGSQAAQADFAAQISLAGTKTAACPSYPVPASQVQCWTLRGDGSPGNPKSDRYWIIAWWSGTAEVEMVAYANTQYATVRKAFHALAAETMGANVATAATPTTTATAAAPSAAQSVRRAPLTGVARAMKRLTLRAVMPRA